MATRTPTSSRPAARRPRARPNRESSELTRKALLRAALKLLAKSSFDNLSLREVTHEAGIAPTTFYRHFDDLEDLGLALVDEAFSSLREMLIGTRSNPALYRDAPRRSIEVVVQHAKDHEGHSRFIARERYGSIRRLRTEINRGLELFAEELAIDLARYPLIGAWTVEDRLMFSGLMVEIMVGIGGAIIDVSTAEEAALIKQAEDQIQLVMLGVALWQSGDDSSG